MLYLILFNKMIHLLVILVSHFCVSFADPEVLFGAVIYRHGDRTPVDTYPKDPWRNESLWPVKFGELTNTGKSQHYALGQWLRKRYSHLLSDGFDPSEINIRSTDVDRTLMSAEANLAGMYPPIGKNIWNDNIMWQPVPIHTVPEKQDEVLAMKKKCPIYEEEKQIMLHSKSYQERLHRYKDLMDYLSANTGREIKDYYGIESIYSILNIETLYNFTLPNWTHSVYPKKMQEPACYSFSTSAATPKLARLIAGPLIKDIMSKMNDYIANPSKAPKVQIYSGHDFTIGTLLTGLGMFNGECPTYTATVFVELIYDKMKSTRAIRISYRDSTRIVEPNVMYIPYCGMSCPLERFLNLYAKLIAVDFDFDCRGPGFADVKVPILTSLSILGGLYFIIKVYMCIIYDTSTEPLLPVSTGKKI